MKCLKALGAAALSLALLLPALSASAASERPEDAKLFADFEGTGTLAEGTKIPGNTANNNEAWLNWFSDADLSLENGALKAVFKRNGGFGIGNQTVYFADGNGEPQYRYLVIRMKGAAGNENRTAGGGFLLSIGGAEGSHVRSLNERDVGTAPPAIGPDGQVLPPLSTEYQNFVIPLTKENVRQASSNAYSLNLNCVANEATIYIDDIYVSNTLPSSVATNPPIQTTTPSTQAPATNPPPTTATTAPEPTGSGGGQTTAAADTTVGAGSQSQPGGPTAGTAATTRAPAGTEESGGLGVGGVIAIVAGVVVVVGGSLAALYFLVIRKKFV